MVMHLLRRVVAVGLSLTLLPSIGFTQSSSSSFLSANNSQLGNGSVDRQSSNNSQPDLALSQNLTSAQSLIIFLQRHPELLPHVKAHMAQSLGIDANAITDQMIYERIQQDQSLRAKIADVLGKKGYEFSNVGAGQTAATGQNSGIQYTGQTQNQPQGGGAQAQYPIQGQLSGQQQSPMQSGIQACPVGYIAQATYPSTAQSSAGGQVSAISPQSFVCQPSPAAQGVVSIQEPAQPVIQQRKPPYSYIPSLMDLYSQMPPPDTTLRRFGSDVFVLGTGNPDNLPLDLPAGPDYVLGPGDALNINIWGSQPNTLGIVVDRQGQVTLPETPSVVVGGLTMTAAQAAIQKSLATRFRDIHVELSLGRVHTVRVYVVGDVQRPGAYDISSLSTPLNALYAAGGPTSRGSLRTLRHYRGKELVREIDLYDFLLKGIRSDIERLLPGDTILVPPVGAQVTVNGMVRRPAIYELKGPEDLNGALNLAGGVLVGASLHEISVERVDAHQRRTMLSVRLGDQSQTGDKHQSGKVDEPGTLQASVTPVLPKASESKTEANDPLSRSNTSLAISNRTGFDVNDGDYILVRPILPYNEAVIYLDGHVFQPGKFPYRDGMTINDVLSSYRDVMPEPADHMELIRLQAPDYRPATTILRVSDVLGGNSPVLLQPFDVIRVFSRYEVDPPTVSIYGEVIRPGDYPMSRGMTVTQLINMAGGFRRSAYREVADLASYELKDGKKVLLQAGTVDLVSALQGNRNADAALKPGDVVGIRQLTGWQDIGSSVTITGELTHPGTYGIVAGEHLSSVLKRAGGFREDAYPAGAVLERATVRQMNEKTRQDLLQRIEAQDFSTSLLDAANAISAQQQTETLQLMRAQRQEALTALRSAPASGRLVIKISADISSWENTPADIELRADDTISIPKRSGFVLVSGQVYSPTALSYVPGKTAQWYLRQAGGATQVANKKDIYIIRADGSIISRGGGSLTPGVLSARLHPGDAIVVPEKLVGNPVWKTLMGTAQALMAPAMLAVAVTR